MNNSLEKNVNDVKSAFSDYFDMVCGKNFKQFYYDWHVDNMLAPFASMVEYFDKNYGKKGKEKFHEFVEDVAFCVDNYDLDNVKLGRLTTKKHGKADDRRLSGYLDGLRTFGFEFRQFVYSFGTKEDHANEFGYWPFKANMPYSSKHGLMVGKDILRYLDKNYDTLTKDDDVYKKSLFMSDYYLRKNVTKEYKYRPGYTFDDRKKAIKRLHDLRNELSKNYQNAQNLSSELKDMFQTPQNDGVVSSDSTYWPNGFELEFYVPKEYGDYGVLIDYLKEKNNWDKLYSSNHDASVYHDAKSAGVIMRDESLAPYKDLAPVEFASRIMRNKEDEKYCLKIFDSFDKGHVNKHCSLHQHLSSDGFDLDTYKRLVKRMMQHEDEIVGAFAAPERRDNNLIYATYISRNLSYNSKRDYPFLAVMVDLCENKKELEEMSAFGSKYKTLNVLPKHTVEMRAMNANFNKKFVEAYLQFNREFVASAVANNPVHLNKVLLNKYTWFNNEQTDEKTVMHDLNYGYDFVPHDSYRPLKYPVSDKTIGEEQDYNRVVSQALTATNKLKYLNPSHIKKMREVKNARK